MTKARDNPFAAERVLSLIRYRPIDFTWAQILARLESLNYRAAIVGPHGSGKTTLIEDLAARLESRGFRCRMLWLNSERRKIDWTSLRGLASGDIVLLDGAEQLSAVAWQAFRFRTRAAGGLIITTHARGRLKTLVETRTSVELLEGIVRDLHDGDLEFDTLFRKHRGNLRDALRALYDLAACAP